MQMERSPRLHPTLMHSPRDRLLQEARLRAVSVAACSQDCADALRFSVQDPLREPSFLTPQNSFHIRIPQCPRCIKISHRSLSLTIPAESLRVNQGRNPELCPASCYIDPSIVLCPSYPQPMVLFPLILASNAAKVIPVIPVRRGLPNPSPKEVAFAQAQEGSDPRLQILL